MNGVTTDDNLTTDVSMPTDVNSSSAAQNEISISDNEVWVSFFLAYFSVKFLFFEDITLIRLRLY